MKENKLVNTEAIDIYNKEKIRSMIYKVRGKQVIMDSDVARLYHTETRNINQTVKRNIERFPERFCFRLTWDEFKNLKSQFVTSSLESKNDYGGRRKLPLVFTEQGIAMISSLIRSEIAIKTSINIMDAFIEMRKFISNNTNMLNRLTTVEYKLLEHDKKFDEVFNELQNNKEEKVTSKIFYNGQIYDAYSLIIKIIKEAKEKILIIDNYIDDTILEMLSKKNKGVEVVILTSNNCNLTKLDIQKFNKQYPTLKLSKTSIFHDRFIVIDNKNLYHIGASLKDLGKKCFGINKIEDINFIKNVKQNFENIKLSILFENFTKK